MNVVQLTTSGQISIPKALRDGFKTKIFTCEKVPEGILFKPVETDTDPFPKTYTLNDLKKGIFAGKNAKEKNLASKIDEILYQ
jgi:bifunctional DNA-binding transcriptional regulator/antitoxin component of YhaV-PrlF toxin-antitoxin module